LGERRVRFTPKRKHGFPGGKTGGKKGLSAVGKHSLLRLGQAGVQGTAMGQNGAAEVLGRGNVQKVKSQWPNYKNAQEFFLVSRCWGDKLDPEGPQCLKQKGPF